MVLGNFILEFPSIKSLILAVTHARAGKVDVCSLCCSRGPDINIHDVCSLYDKLFTAPSTVKMCVMLRLPADNT